MRWLPLLLACCTSGMYESTAVEQTACVGLEGKTFTSVNELECGRGPNGPVPCHWQVAFAIGDTATSDITWSYSDVAETGKATCRDRTVTATLGNRTLTATMDLPTQLSWAGEIYVVAP
jgi:hypothetical protein